MKPSKEESFVGIDFANGQPSFEFFILDTSNKVKLIHYQNGAWNNTSEENKIASDNIMPGSPMMALSLYHEIA
jgi:hypothetical protein